MSTHGHVSHLVCTTCGQLRSVDVDASIRPDRCQCIERHDDRFDAEDLIACSICASCALTIVRGHTRWHLLHCEECRGQVHQLNQNAGRLVVPIGIHTIVNGLALPAADANSDSKLEVFAAEMTSLFDRISALQRHVDRLVTDRLTSAGLDRFDTVTYDTYLNACRERSITADNGRAELTRFVDEVTR
jgi:hypothetical protein